MMNARPWLIVVLLSWRPLVALDPDEVAPKVVTTFETLSSAGKVLLRDARLSRLVALYIPEGEAPTPFLPVGPFRVIWEGFIDVEFFDEYTFRAEGRGSFELEINGHDVLKTQGEDLARVSSKPIEIEGGKQPFVARYQSPVTGAAVLRLSWSSFDFPNGEPPTPSILGHNPNHPLLRKSQQLRLARELIATRGCLKCHQPEPRWSQSESGMPELKREAPSLEGIGDRLHTAWMAHWLDDPPSIRKDATMPRLFGSKKETDAIDQRCLDIAAFLATLKASDAVTPPNDGSDKAGRGGQVFAELGCVACHLFNPDATGGSSPKDEFDRISLSHVAAKWKPRRLREFLTGPERHYAWTRMPNFRLSDREAEALEAFLLSERPVQPVAGDPRRGRELIESSGCLNCHSLKLENRFQAPALKGVMASEGYRGCLAADVTQRRGAPDFGFTPQERQALRAFWEVGLSSLGTRSPEEFAARQLRALRCVSCHIRDGIVDLWSQLEEEQPALESNRRTDPADNGEATLLQDRPHLTWTGEKLRPEWLTRFLNSDIKVPLRPWLKARMPRFATQAQLLAEGLARQHGFSPASAEQVKKDAQLAETGKKLVQRDYFACVTCHDVGDEKAVGVFEAKGTNFQYVTSRLRRDFYHRWMLDPVRIAPETKMPAFVSEGRSPFEIFDYDGRKQFEAIWHYFLEIAEPE